MKMINRHIRKLDKLDKDNKLKINKRYIIENIEELPDELLSRKTGQLVEDLKMDKMKIYIDDISRILGDLEDDELKSLRDEICKKTGKNCNMKKTDLIKFLSLMMYSKAPIAIPYTLYSSEPSDVFPMIIEYIKSGKIPLK